MDFKKRARELVSKMSLAEKMSQMKFDSPPIERLGIPGYNWWNEGLHGVARSGSAACFPQAIGMAATFDPSLVFRIGEAVSKEARAKYNGYRIFGGTGIYQGLTLWSPNINIFRDPRWGRGHETYGEDPYLTAVTGAAYVDGLQGDDEKYRRVDATLKHFAVHSGPESSRHSFDVQPSKRDLWQTYLFAFDYIIRKSRVAAVMGAYNRLDGVPCCGSEELLEENLRGRMGFEGYVVSDCGAIYDFYNGHGTSPDAPHAAAQAVKAGCDLNCGGAYASLNVAYETGLLTEEDIDRSVIRLFEARMRLGMFDDDCPYNSIPKDAYDTKEHAALSREAAVDSIVLLKNNGILPLNPGKKYAVIGPVADDKLVLLGNYHGTPKKTTTLQRGIIEEVEAAGGSVLCARGCHIVCKDLGSWEENPLREALVAASEADIVIMCLGLNPTFEGEEGDGYNSQRGGDKPDIDIPEVQLELFREIAKLGKPIVFVSVSGSCLNLCEADEKADAVLQCFYPGAEGGYALADVLFGRVSPSGRLPLTFYRSTDDLPPFDDYSMENRTYRYFKGKPLYPFGFGLSYTSFSYSFKNAKKTDSGITIKLSVKNTGSRDSKEAVTLYLAAGDNEDEPPVRLIYLKKIFIRAGDEFELDCEIEQDALKYADSVGNYRMPSGSRLVLAGSCRDESAKARKIIQL
ncbi:MAG: glycoside hydrolase family 3 protein [Clostridiales bacterium]|jgi:beta-glucosidase|nr:glycoside hydrolase family 3 protein [Clostridiales bacterium]